MNWFCFNLPDVVNEMKLNSKKIENGDINSKVYKIQVQKLDNQEYQTKEN